MKYRTSQGARSQVYRRVCKHDGAWKLAKDIYALKTDFSAHSANAAVEMP